MWVCSLIVLVTRIVILAFTQTPATPIDNFHLVAKWFMAGIEAVGGDKFQAADGPIAQIPAISSALAGKLFPPTSAVLDASVSPPAPPAPVSPPPAPHGQPSYYRRFTVFNSYTSTEIVKYVIASALFILSAMAPYAVVIAKKHLSPSQIDTVVWIVRIVTLGVEQIAPVLALIGPAKYAEAVARMVSLLSSHGITLSASDIQTYIESGVRELKAAGQELIQTPALPVTVTSVVSVPAVGEGPHPT